ncbi:ferric ABC transporter ATP-binding protein [Xenorhabdus bovienii]|uniref:Ferric transport protein (ABC superfamily,atp_bind) n=1 Tax=Xenorhabdus bovienii str. Intermedium TaxID=1379677 RepID=A0A077QMJ4_XENBV|nr:ferric ABC transporter ATP-binding protein [Xenorhabdus bovienii]MDE9454710.1 ferric ABC transporter ATP-binding protein [Xenorhabdus bovienii]MDE9541751.1 ferric ABC transporter ATP-binding protein [Xenorhabdus bovienii]MDE9556398.1 ferric ABC transporter ATP-binding protein [Xenorhabdus bovienii]MDE9565614.1 ferric ABC transporter ATP-binding protein [Xenorhabdus bovienii]CDH34570.1 ferric transport protein (ABC superfamily,atp_bind) [Xenorhabdus bovienii str. Intermedium]
MTQQHFVELKNVTKRFGSNAVIDSLNLSIPQGHMVTLLGPSGCGKTTVLRLVAGLEKPSEGNIFIDSEDVTERSIQQRDICMVFQSYALFPHLSLGENIGYGLKMQGRPKAEIREQVREALELVDLAGFEDRYVDQISGGQQQRVALARALILKPKVLLFDEPLSNLDANLRRNMREKIRELQQRFNITSLYVTHDQSEAFAVSDTVLVMNKGKIMQIGSPQTLYRHPASRFMASFMGDANIFPATLGLDYVEIFQYRLPRPAHFTTTRSSITVGIRPEAITLNQQGSESQRCKVSHVAYMGAQYEVTVDWHGQTLLLQINATQLQPRVGEEYYLEIHLVGMFVLEEEI